MATIDHAPPRSTGGNIEIVNDEKANIAHAEHVEHTRTNDTDIAPEKLAVDAKVDEFGARSKTDPREIALVKKLDRTILVSSRHPV